MAQTESLTIQILGDSSGLSQELNNVARQIEELQQRLSGSLDAAGSLGRTFGGLAGAVGPVRELTSELGILSQQLTTISHRPVTLNVQPALQSLGQLLQRIQAVTSQLAALNAREPIAAVSGSNQRSGLIRGFAGGGIVTGPGGIDQVTARLTAGEFVLNRDAVSTFGIALLERMNQGRATPEWFVPEPHQRSFPVTDTIPDGLTSSRRGTGLASAFRRGVGEGTSVQTTNHFGGIEIHVRETADVGQIVQDLRRQGLRQRHRYG